MEKNTILRALVYQLPKTVILALFLLYTGGASCVAVRNDRFFYMLNLAAFKTSAKSLTFSAVKTSLSLVTSLGYSFVFAK